MSRLFVQRLRNPLCLLLMLGASSAYADDAWRILPEQANCLLANKATYLAADADVLIIDVNNCPDPSPFAGALDGLSNFGGISQIESQPSRDGLDSIITYTRQEIECLDENEVLVEGGTALLPRVVKCDD